MTAALVKWIIGHPVGPPPDSCFGWGMDSDQQLYVQATPDGVSRLVDRLDLSRFFAAGLVITRALVIGERIRLEFSWEGVGDEVVLIRRADDKPAFMSNRRLALSVGGTSVSRPYQILLGRIALSSGDADIDDLILVLSGGRHEKTSDTVDSTIKSFGVEDAWSEFFCDHAMARKFYEALQFEDNASVLVHGDLECKFITPRFRAALPRFFNYPWKIFGDSEGSDPLTNLTDHDVIYGGEQRLEDHIEDMLAHKRRSGPVIINSTCVPVVIGDDVDKVMSMFSGRCPEGMYHLSPVTEDPREIMMQYLDDAREKALAGAGAEKGSIALVGFRAGRTHSELASLISECGVAIKGTILPRASSRLMAQVMQAEVLVFRPSTFMTELYDRVFVGCGQNKIYPDPPFGIAGTSAWLRAIADSVGRAGDAEMVVGKAEEACRSELDSLRLAASVHEMTFVANPSNPARLTDPVGATGLAVLPAVAELGYRIRVLARDDVPALFRDFRDKIQAWADQNRVDVIIEGFGDRDALSAAIRAGRGGAVFSEFFYDSRISREGRQQFSARDFEMGYSGALRTARRLLRLSGMPFYGRYGDLIAAQGGSRDWWKL